MSGNDLYKNYSLLWSGGREYYNNEYHKIRSSCIIKNSDVIRDLELENVFKVIPVASSSKTYDALSILDFLTNDEEIIKYRLDIIEDLLNNEVIYKGFKRLASEIGDLKAINQIVTGAAGDMLQLSSVISELDKYIECVYELNSILDDPGVKLKSEALQKLHAIFAETVGCDAFQSLIKRIKTLKQGIRGLKSVTLGINLNERYTPAEIVLLELKNQSYSVRTLTLSALEKVFGKDEYLGMMKIQPGGNNPKNPQSNTAPQLMIEGVSALLNRLVRGSLDYNETARFTKVDSKFLIGLGMEMEFYIGAVNFIKLMESSGVPICKPEVRPSEERVCTIENLYNVNLVLRLREQYKAINVSRLVVGSDINFGSNGRIFILTGPNQGGKTTFIQSVGIAQVLLQLGIYVPGSSAVMSPVDGIYTHFPAEEEPDSNMGRMGEECTRINDIFEMITSRSLILLNETLTSTNPMEGIYIAKEIMAGFKAVGARAVYATHFHDLARNLDKFNAQFPGDSRAVSLVSGVKKNESADGENRYIYKRTYKVEEAPPIGLSYAHDIADRYGVSIEKIVSKLSSRNMLDKDIDVQGMKNAVS